MNDKYPECPDCKMRIPGVCITPRRDEDNNLIYHKKWVCVCGYTKEEEENIGKD